MPVGIIATKYARMMVRSIQFILDETVPAILVYLSWIREGFLERTVRGGAMATDDMSRCFMERVVELALVNVRAGKGGPFAALVVKDGAILACGVNAVTATNDPTAHAEIVAIRQACRDLGHFQLVGCDIYASCEPCPMCLGAIYWARPARVFFGASRRDAAAAGFDDSLIYEQLGMPAERRRIPMFRIECAGALAPFEEWARSAARVEY